ncbi:MULTISPECIES: hypothetical protein [unclassified Bradyrhizobium]|uniref:hypothetical protein n=1 Tax=unclassified Bradyrhizobium TaxID=2631580 RepID=UPI001BA5FA75|nr:MULTISPECIES: hypothetical protein [unclassified Bradyrhizobium]MBR1203383.1 hypothetical protein [Bradyrhizobium sp. AUGA SZCCT0124]MBR1313046.1 hypothetical protein [Bradyrhizobium sp. AUGA SZCCT0051]MBR1341404.1 hypothetical protein [Bradyrhizobium sp. AUGA SZCCT0105]MBR1356658.1 hypothetical protein [Bradyrhizobium sp. AUGA SZCCT0045]
MKLFTGSIAAAALAFSAASAQAQLVTSVRIGSPSFVRVSDMGGPYAAMPEVPPPPRFGRVPSLLPPVEVYTVLRENGYLPLGAPQQRGFVYTISVIDQGGDDGRLVIDARDGHIVRFTPAYRLGDNFEEEMSETYGPVGPMPRAIQARVPRPPLPIPHVASRVPVPKRSPLAARAAPGPAPASAPAAAQAPAPAAQAAVAPTAAPQPAPTQAAAPEPAAAAPKPAEAQAAAPQAVQQAEAPTVGQAAPPPPAPAILPTQAMPKVQGLE